MRPVMVDVPDVDHSGAAIKAAADTRLTRLTCHAAGRLAARRAALEDK
jgi:hypothetical protein